jgi:HTH-type transcriptional regulator/antitoxin HigA
MVLSYTIRNNTDHKEALKEIERLMTAEVGTPEGDRLEVLISHD